MGGLGYFLREASHRPVGFLLRRAADLAKRTGRTILDAVGVDPYAPHLDAVAPREAGSLYAPAGVDRFLDLVARHRPWELRALVARADALAGGEVRVLSHRVDVRGAFDWQDDFVSRHRWPVRFHTRYRYADLLDRDRPSDVKIPWELGRLQGLPVLALAYRRSGRRSYVQSALGLLEDWRRACPVGYGVVWTVGMEAALRAVSVVLFSELLGATPEEETGRRLEPWLAAHGRFLARNLEYSDVSGNHYTSCLLGLLCLGLHLPHEREARRWVETAVGELRRELPRQTYPDGVCHEGSIAYHRLVLELFFHADRLARARGIEMGSGFATRLQLMLAATRGWLKPDGRVPVWGDNDDGRVIALADEALDDHRYLLVAGAARFRRPDLWPPSSPLAPPPPLLDALPFLCEDDLPALGELLTARAATSEPAGPETRSVAFPDGGFYILRRSRGYALVDCGDVGLRGRGGHGHNDALSVELVLAGLDVLTDTGCASYTRSLERRLETLSARSHNAPVVDGAEPAPIALERLPHATACPVRLLSWEPAEGRFAGRHDGYQRSGVAGVVERRVELAAEGDAATIEDLVGGDVGRQVVVEWSFHLAPRWRFPEIGRPATDEGTRVSFGDGAGNRLLIHLQLGGNAEVDIMVEEGRYYPSYDRPKERLRLRLTHRGALPVRGGFEFCVILSGSEP